MSSGYGETYEPLPESVRALIDASIRTPADAETVAAARAEIDAVTARLRSRQLDGAFGVQFTSDGDQMPWGNPVVGIRNPVAPPLVIHRDETAACPPISTWARPTRVRRVTSTAGWPHGYSITCWGRPPATGARRDSPARSSCAICAPRASAGCTRRRRWRGSRGSRHFVVGHFADEDGVTVGEGVFITPRWAREEA